MRGSGRWLRRRLSLGFDAGWGLAAGRCGGDRKRRQRLVAIDLLSDLLRHHRNRGRSKGGRGGRWPG